MVQRVAENAETAYKRANPPKPKQRGVRKMQSESGERPETATRRPLLTPANRSLTTPSDEMNDVVDEEDAGIAEGLEEDEEMDDDDLLGDESFPFRAAAPTARVFSPAAASGSARRMQLQQQDMETSNERAKELGKIGASGGGLYLVLHADDIHSTQQLLDALRDFLSISNYYTESLLNNLARALRQFGQLVIWGTMEVVSRCGENQVLLWMDGDEVAAARIGAVFLERAHRLTQNDMFCSIMTRNELIVEQRAVAVLQWLSAVARSCDPLCMTVAESILPNRHLVPLLRADFKMSARVTKAWYSLLLTLLAVPTFKSHLAAAYCDTYRIVTAKYARGMGVLERSGYTLSVQFLNRVTYVIIWSKAGTYWEN